MSRPSPRRFAAGLLTVGVAASGLLLTAPVAQAADLPALTVSATRVDPGQFITVSGTGCLEPRIEDGVGLPGVILESPDGLHIGDGSEVRADGSWSLREPISVTAVNGTYVLQATCSQYERDVPYPPVTITVGPLAATATTTPAPAPQPLATGDRTTYDKITAGTPFTLGEQFTASYPGFKPFEVVTVVLHSTPQTVGTFTANASGVVTVSFKIPTGTEAGSHSLAMSGSLGTQFTQALKVSTSRSLAYTGADVAMPLTIGGSLLLVGGALTVAARRRRAGVSQA